MKKSMFIGLLGMFFLLTLLFNSCTSTKIISSWANPSGQFGQYQKVLVIGLMGSKDRELREEIENSMVRTLSSHGINAGSAYAEYGPKAFDGLSEKEAIKKIRDKGYDGTFTVALLDRKKQRTYYPPSVGYFPQTYRFWGHYRTLYARIYEPGYYTVSTNFMLEANFYKLGSDELLYSLQTKTSAPNSPQSLATEFSEVLINDMRSKGLVK